MRNLAMLCLAATLGTGVSVAEKGQIIGTVTCVRSGVPVSTHPVMVVQGRETLARTLTDRLGKFKLEFNYSAGKPLVIRTGPTSLYLPAQGEVEPDTDVTIAVMPAWATILGIVTDRRTGRGLPDIVVRAGRGDKLIAESWATAKTDPTGVYLLKVLAFDGDDVTRPVQDLWLSVNEGEGANEAYAVVRTDPIPLWAWPDPTQPTKVEISLPGRDATGLTIADVVAIRVPETLAAAAATPAPSATSPPEPTIPASAPAEVHTAEFTIVCPHCGQKLRVIIQPAP